MYTIVFLLGMLKPGTYRELTKAEVNGLRAAAVKGRAPVSYTHLVPQKRVRS